MLIEISRYQQQHSTRNSFLRASRGVETPIRTKSIGAFGNVNTPPPFQCVTCAPFQVNLLVAKKNRAPAPEKTRCPAEQRGLYWRKPPASAQIQHNSG